MDNMISKIEFNPIKNTVIEYGQEINDLKDFSVKIKDL